MMMWGYLTVFLSLSLSVLSGFIICLAGNAIRNAENVRLECAADLGMNSMLGEFHTGLHDRYDLLYVDASYQGMSPSAANVEERLRFYINENIREDENSPWGVWKLVSVEAAEFTTAAEAEGGSMKQQAVCYIEDGGIRREETEIEALLGKVEALEGRNGLAEWSALMEMIGGMELPQIQNEEGEWEEVPLGNPADGIFALAGSNIIYLLSLQTDQIGVGRIPLEEYLSHRGSSNTGKGTAREADTMQFLTYLFEKMGNYNRVREGSFLHNQLEYVVCGKASDFENLQGVAQRLFQWRFAVNIDYVMGNDSFFQEALGIADSLFAVQLKESFREPVATSVLYACAYLETLSELRTLFQGGRISNDKDSFLTGMEQVLTGTIAEGQETGQVSYEQYLACMLFLLSEKDRNLRSMDIMEMDIRSLGGNLEFAMDWCMERVTVTVTAQNSRGSLCSLQRTYGYY